MPFHYKPLDRNISEIRLLRLHPLKTKAARKSNLCATLSNCYSMQRPSKVLGIYPPSPLILECSIYHASLDEQLPFEFNALSYTWGPKTPLRHITLNGQLFEIRENLWNFLCVAVRKKEILHVPLWVDQICVDQDAIEERNHQVTLMGNIYSQASTVFMWLGPDTKNSDLAMKYLERVEDFTPERIGLEPLFASRKKFFALVDLLERPYWSRLWIVQEVLLARRLVLVCGKRTSSWQSFESIVQALNYHKSHVPLQVSNGVEVAVKIAAMKKQRAEAPKGLELSTLVVNFRDQECSDGRDLIFGLLSLVDTRNASIEANYNLSPQKVVMETFKAIHSQRSTNWGDENALLGLAQAVTRPAKGDQQSAGMFRLLLGIARGYINLYQLVIHLSWEDDEMSIIFRDVFSHIENGDDLLDWWRFGQETPDHIHRIQHAGWDAGTTFDEKKRQVLQSMTLVKSWPYDKDWKLYTQRGGLHEPTLFTRQAERFYTWIPRNWVSWSIKSF